MELVVTRKDMIAADTVMIRLAAQGEDFLPAFKPGAHIEISVDGMSRRYSLTSSPHARGYYEFRVLHTRPSRGGSAYLHDALRIGDAVAVSGPFNAFALNTEARHSVFIAGGIGITPFYTMMEALRERGRSFELHYTARTHDRLLPTHDYEAQTNLYVDEGGMPGLDVEQLLHSLEADSDLYVCGPRALIEAVRLKATEHGWPRQAVHFESFGYAPRPDDTPITVHLVQSGMTIDVKPGISILDALEAAGVWAPFECRRGECGSCVAGIVSGDADHRDVCLTPEQRRQGVCTCVSWSFSNELTLDL